MIEHDTGDASPRVADSSGDHTAEARPIIPGIGGVWALLLGLGLLMMGNGLNGAVIGIRSTNEGFSVTECPRPRVAAGRWRSTCSCR